MIYSAVDAAKRYYKTTPRRQKVFELLGYRLRFLETIEGYMAVLQKHLNKSPHRRQEIEEAIQRYQKKIKETEKEIAVLQIVKQWQDDEKKRPISDVNGPSTSNSPKRRRL